MISEISRVGRRVVDILNTVDNFHQKGIGLFVQQFNMTSMENEKENPVVMLLLQTLSIGAELEYSHRAMRQKEGIALRKLQNPEKYQGRKTGARANRDKLLKKYQDIVDLINKSELSLRKISRLTGRSVNTVRKVHAMLNNP